MWNRHLGYVSSRCIIQQDKIFDLSEKNACEQFFLQTETRDSPCRDLQRNSKPMVNNHFVDTFQRLIGSFKLGKFQWKKKMMNKMKRNGKRQLYKEVCPPPTSAPGPGTFGKLPPSSNPAPWIVLSLFWRVWGASNGEMEVRVLKFEINLFCLDPLEQCEINCVRSANSAKMTF